MTTCAACSGSAAANRPGEVQRVVTADEQGSATSGCVRIRAGGEWTAASNHSRGPGGADRPAGGRARSASVTGPPRTSSIGTSIERIMCCPCAR